MGSRFLCLGVTQSVSFPDCTRVPCYIVLMCIWLAVDGFYLLSSLAGSFIYIYSYITIAVESSY